MTPSFSYLEEELKKEIRHHEKWSTRDWYTALILRWAAIIGSIVATACITFQGMNPDAGIWKVVTIVAAAAPTLAAVINSQIPYEATHKWHEFAVIEFKALLGELVLKKKDEAKINGDLERLRKTLLNSRPRGEDVSMLRRRGAE